MERLLQVAQYPPLWRSESVDVIGCSSSPKARRSQDPGGVFCSCLCQRLSLCSVQIEAEDYDAAKQITAEIARLRECDEVRELEDRKKAAVRSCPMLV